MSNKIKTLLLYSNGYGSLGVALNTLTRGILKIKYNYKPPAFYSKIPILNLLSQYILNQYEFLSYVNDWKDAFQNSNKLSIDAFNTTNLFELSSIKKRIKEYELIVILHSALGDDITQIEKITQVLLQRNSKLVVFIGNEYDLLPAKKAFMKNVKADYICSQLKIEAANWLYTDCDSSKILAIPHALNPEVYSNLSLKKKYSVGFIGTQYPLFIGDVERNSFIEKFQNLNIKPKLPIAIEAGRRKYLSRKDWALFLNKCIATIGVEAGTYFLDKDGKILETAKQYIKNNPHTSFDELYELFFAALPFECKSGKTLSSRHFEPIGTKTCQILLEGEYNGILKKDINYIPVKKDFSDINEAVEKLNDQSLIQKITNETYDYIMCEHTYNHRINYLMSQIEV